MKQAAGIFAAGVCLFAGMAVRADEWPEAKVRALDRRALEAVADLALVPPPLNTSPGPEYGAAKERWAMNNGAALTPKGRLWASWIGGGDSPDAYTVCAFSDDNGETWNPPSLVVDGHDPKHLPFPRSNIIANLWTDPAGRLRLFVSQSMWHNDGRMGVWETVCANPDDAKPKWSPIRRLCDGAVLNKPIVLKNGTWLLPIEVPGTWGMFSGMFGTKTGAFALASTDGGKTWTRRGGVTVPESTWTEPHFLELKDGAIRMYMRTWKGLRMAESHDEGRTWGGVTKPAGMDQPDARCQVRALASGNWIFVKHLSPPDSYNDNKRIGLIAYLSRDEGRTWEGGLVLDARKAVTYPDVEQGPDGTIYVTHDFERGREAEIILHKFTEADILAKKFQSPQSRQGIVVMKAMGTEHNKGRQKQSGLAVSETVNLWKGAPVTRATEQAVIPVASLGCGGLAADAAIDIDTGRQLFVDDYLVESTAGIVRHWNKPVKMEAPVVWPKNGAAPKKTDGSAKTKKGDEAVNLTCATDGGLWWDPEKRKFRLWYQADWLGDICYAESTDGVNWEYPDLGVVPGTNRIFEYDKIDSWSVTPNYAAANPYADWRLHISAPGMWTTDTLYSSSDGIHFDELGVAGMSGDRSTSYYDPFRGVWVFSLRDGRPKVGRSRCYFASKEFGGDKCHWSWPKCTSQAESLRKFAPPEEWLVATNGPRRSLYSFNAVAYESLMLGVMEILYNTPGDNADCDKAGLPKQTALHFAFSRDGKTYEPRKDADIAPEGWGSGKWDTGYLSALGGICVVKDERLWFYYSGLRGDTTRRGRDFGGWHRNGMYSNGSIGVATLRRDGFAGMVADGMGEIVTKPVVFSGSRLFVNAESRFGYVEAEVLDVAGNPIPGYTRYDCAAFWHGDSTKRELVFKGRDLAALAGREVRFRFLLKCATLYSFWVSPTAFGESRGYVAGGGPAYRGLRDMPPADILKSRTFPADYVKKPDPKAHAVNARASTLVSSMAVAPNGRLWATWYCGITPAEDQNNYVVLSTSTDDGRTWQEVFVADPDGAGMERPFDPEVWVAPDGSLRWIWADRICRDLCGRKDKAYPDILMMSTIPDANVVPDEPPQPRPIAEGIMMCKPTVLTDGTWAFPAAKWGGKPWSSCLYASTDGGKTFVLRGGAKVPQEDTEFDEHMFVERKNGDLVCYSRAKSGIRETVSKDGGFSWGECVKSKLPHPSARCFVRKLKSGAWLLVKHGGLGEAKRRSHLTAYVSDDEGATWKGGLLLEERWGCSYPDGQETADGTIYITYDWDRYNDRTIYFCTFTEEDVRAGKAVSGKVRLRQVISQGRGRPVVDPVYVGAPRKDHFWNLRKWSGNAVQISAPGGRMWKTWCADAKRDFDSHDAYAILATSTDGGKKWKEVIVVDPDDFWPRRPENASLALEDGKLVWSWIDRISWNKDGAEQKWRLVLDAEKEPSPDAAFKAELVTGK